MPLLASLALAVTLSAADATRDVAVLEQALTTVHPALTRYTSQRELDRRFAALRELAKQPVDDARLYVEISRLLAAIRCDHTKAELPASIATMRKAMPAHLPFRFRIFDGRMYVASSDPNQPLARGTELLAIDGRPVKTILAALSELVSYDGDTRHVVPAKLAADSDLLGSDFDHFYPLVYGFRDTLTLTTRAGAVTVKPISFEEWTKLEWSSKPYRAEFASSVSFRMLDAKTGYLRVDTFVNYRNPVDPHTVYAPHFRQLAEHGATHLVLDLRENGGGSNDAAIALAQYLIPRPFRITRSVRLKAIRYGDLPQFIETWGDRKAIFEPAEEKFRRLADGTFEEVDAPLVEPVAQHAFGGKLTILTGPANASGTTILIARIRDARPVRIAGAATGGSAEGPSAGQIFFVKLPHSGITVRVPVKRSYTDVRTFRKGRGIEPDLRVEETLEAFLARRDPVLEAAIR